MDDRILKKLDQSLVILLFCATIFIPFFVGIIQTDVVVSEIEKRKLTALPATPHSINEVKAFPRRFDQYYSDHFGFRSHFSSYYKRAKYLLGESTTENVTFGQEGWLFLGSIRKPVHGDPIGDAQGTNQFTQQQLQDFARYISGLNAWLKSRNIQYVFMIAPDKHSIYFDRLPGYILKKHPQTATDQLVSYLREHTDVAVVDVRDALIRQKESKPLYYKTGTHWNFMGGNIAQFEIMKRIKKMFPGQIQPELYADSHFVFSTANDRGLEKMAGIDVRPVPAAPYPVLEPGGEPITDYPKDKEGNDLMQPVHTLVNDSENLNAVIFRDSFFRVLEPYFHRKFRRSTFIWERISYPRLKEQVELQKPDIVIEEWVERILPYVPKTDPEFEKNYQQDLFEKSHQQIVAIDQNQLQINDSLQVIEKQRGRTRLKTTGKAPVIILPSIAVERATENILRIKLHSSTPTTIQVVPNTLSGINAKKLITASPRHQINRGDNVLFIPVNSFAANCSLHLQPISQEDEITIQSLEIKQVSGVKQGHAKPSSP